MRTASVIISKIELAILRRLPFALRSAYVPALGRVVREPSRISSVFSEIYWSDLYKPLRPIPDGATIVDLGANLGIFSIYATQICRRPKIHVFEASPLVYPILLENIRALSGATISAHNVAVTNFEGTIAFNVDRANPFSLEATAFRDISTYANPATFETVDVPAGRLGGYVTSFIDFLKCDIEGAEYSALEGLLSTDRVGQAVIEFHEIGRNWEAFTGLMDAAASQGFAILDREGQRLRVDATLKAGAEQNIIVKLLSPALQATTA